MRTARSHFAGHSF